MRALGVLTVAIGLTLSSSGCRKVPPASTPTPDTGPTPTSIAVAEAEPDAAPETSATPAALHPTLPVDMLARAYACWFDRPYEYMFDGGGPTLELGSGGHTRLMAGIGGIMHYGSLTRCIGEQTGVAKSAYSALQPIAQLAGMPIWIDDPGPHGFRHLNPEIVRWGENALLIDPRTELAPGVTARKAYVIVFSRFFRVMAHSYGELKTTDDFAAEIVRYLDAVDRGADGIDYLQSRFGGRLNGYGGHPDGTQMTPAMAFGFWLRRGADGTDAQLWSSLRRLLWHYDREWLANLESRYGLPSAP